MTGAQDEPLVSAIIRLQHENAKFRKENEELRNGLQDAAMHLETAARLKAALKQGEPVGLEWFEDRTNLFAVAARHARIIAQGGDLTAPPGPARYGRA